MLEALGSREGKGIFLWGLQYFFDENKGKYNCAVLVRKAQWLGLPYSSLNEETLNQGQ
jgi:hypothetical protein